MMRTIQFHSIVWMLGSPPAPPMYLMQLTYSLCIQYVTYSPNLPLRLYVVVCMGCISAHLKHMVGQ